MASSWQCFRRSSAELGLFLETKKNHKESRDESLFYGKKSMLK